MCNVQTIATSRIIFDYNASNEQLPQPLNLDNFAKGNLNKRIGVIMVRADWAVSGTIKVTKCVVDAAL